MSNAIIKNKIKKAIRHEKSTDALTQLVVKTALNNGKHITFNQAKEVTQLVIKYVNLVPQFIEEGKIASRNLGIQQQMNQMMTELTYYWELEEDLIPDHLGLIGITDDAYASLYLLQTLSEYCKNMYQRPLLQTDFTNSNQFIRGLLGEQVASTLEQKVQLTIGNNLAGNIMNQVYQNIFSSGFSFGNAAQVYMDQRDIEEKVNVQMGAMGIV